MKEYIGDGVYVEYIDYRGMTILTTEDGISIQNKIYLEPRVMESLIGFLIRHKIIDPKEKE